MKFLKKKSLGQNFLKSRSVVETIIKAGDLNPDDIVLEIGPGEGFMTEELLKASGKIIAIEKDERLIPILNEKFYEKIKGGRFEIIQMDILDFNIETLKKYGDQYKVIANIPYYITGQIIRKFLESNYKPKLMILLLQKEVAERIVAKDSKESLLSLSVKIFGEPIIIRRVSKNLFSPVPKVDSAVLLIENISTSKLEKIDSKLFFKFIHSGFKHKRKQLIPNLSSDFDKNKIQRAFKKLNLNEKIRAEDLSLDQWVKLIKEII